MKNSHSFDQIINDFKSNRLSIFNMEKLYHKANKSTFIPIHKYNKKLFQTSFSKKNVKKFDLLNKFSFEKLGTPRICVKNKCIITAFQRNLIDAAKFNRLSYIEKVLQKIKKEDLAIEDKLGNTALFYAVQNENWNIIKHFVHLGSNINHQNKLGNTVLHLAFKKKDMKVFIKS